jgi:hypothetical protein
MTDLTSDADSRQVGADDAGEPFRVGRSAELSRMGRRFPAVLAPSRPHL